MATFKAIILHGNNDLKYDGKINTKIIVTLLRKVNYINTDLFIIPSHFNNKEGVLKRGLNKDFVNVQLSELIHKYNLNVFNLGDRINYMTVTELKKHLLSGKINSKQIDFFEFIEEFVSKVRVKGTADQYLSLMASLKSFVGEKLPISEIRMNFLYRYEAFLRSRNVENGIINYMRTFRSLFNKCRDEYNDEDMGDILIPHYPFRKYKMPKRVEKTKEHVLTVEELKMFMNHKHFNDGEQFARDMFMLMFYLIGIEAKDLFYLKKPVRGRLFYDRYKTGKEYSILPEPEALEIIKRYEGTNLLLNVSERFQHHKSFYRYINNYMSGEKYHNITGIFQRLRIQKIVTTKWARHSWATIARNECQINKDDIALCLGHEDIDNRVTDIYIKHDYFIIDNSNRKVISFINN